MTTQMNRFKIQQQLEGVRNSLVEANNKLMGLYEDVKSDKDQRAKQQEIVKDLEERERGLKAQLDKLDAEAAAKAKAQAEAAKAKNPIGSATSEKEKFIKAKASFIRNVMFGKSIPNEVKNVLGDGSSLGEGGKILPKTMTTELLHEPMVKNPLRGISTFTNITNLEIPKIAFSLDDDDFLTSDTETAKELKASADIITFTRHKFKVLCDITETVLNGTDTNLVSVVDVGLESGLAKKEKKIAFEQTAPTNMSFYYKNATNPNGSTEDYVIKKVSGKTMFVAILAALADLEDDYSENARIVMKKSDYYAMITDLANGNTTLYAAQPEQVLGAPVTFCDMATIPVVGDFSYSHFNYDLNMIYDRDKNVKTGVESFVLTAWIDHQIKMKSAFRLAIVTP